MEAGRWWVGGGGYVPHIFTTDSGGFDENYIEVHQPLCSATVFERF
jgi:hypothetical protein